MTDAERNAAEKWMAAVTRRRLKRFAQQPNSPAIRAEIKQAINDIADDFHAWLDELLGIDGNPELDMNVDVSITGERLRMTVQIEFPHGPG